MVLAHPGSRERNQRQPKQQMKVGPEEATAHTFDDLKKMMVISPVNAPQNETQNVTEEDRRERSQRQQIRSSGHAKLKDHDRNNDCDNAVTKGFDAIAGHFRLRILTRPFSPILKGSRVYLYSRLTLCRQNRIFWPLSSAVVRAVACFR